MFFFSKTKKIDFFPFDKKSLKKIIEISSALIPINRGEFFADGWTRRHFR